jgi:hypothetical protein
MMKYVMTLRLGRTILAIVVGLSVAILPAAAGFATSAAMTEMSVSASMPDCDHHRHHTAPSDKTQKPAHGCADMATCALNCFNFTPTACSDITFSSPASAALKPVRTADKLPVQMASAPFRPPRA